MKSRHNEKARIVSGGLIVHASRCRESFRFLVWINLILIGGCTDGLNTIVSQEPTAAEATPVHNDLLSLPPPARGPIVVAVYGFADQTGQYEDKDNYQSLSRAVTQGGSSVLVKALLDTGEGSWFSVVERTNLDHVLQERQIIRETRLLYEGATEAQARDFLPPLLFAGMLIEGGIVGYDSNIATGGFGARLLGIGGSTEYRQDVATVYLRAISVGSSEVLHSVQVSKTVFSIGVGASVFRYVSPDAILEVEAGITSNEPAFLAIKQAVEKAVTAMIFEGAAAGTWAFADPEAVGPLIQSYFDEKGDPVVPFGSRDEDEDTSTDSAEPVPDATPAPEVKGPGPLADTAGPADVIHVPATQLNAVP